MQQAQVPLPVQYKLSDYYLIWENTIHRKWITCFTDPAATRPITFLSPKRDTFQNWWSEQQEPNNQNSSPEFPESWKDQESRYLSCNTKCQEWKCRMQSNTNGRRRKKKIVAKKKKKKKIKSSYNAELCILRPSEGECSLQSQVVKNNGIAKAQKRNNAKKSSMLSSSLTVQLSNTEPNQRHRSPKGKQGA